MEKLKEVCDCTEKCEAGELAAKLLDVMLESNKTLETAEEATDMLHAMIRYAKAQTPIMEAVIAPEDAEYLRKMLAQKK